MPLRMVDHPLIKHKMSIMRNAETSTKKFRKLVDEVTQLLAYEATRGLETVPCDVTTPLGPCQGQTLKQPHVVIAPVLRAGLGMVQGMLDMLPRACVAHLGLFRDEQTLQPKVYYQSMPRTLEDAVVFIVDPMLATGGSMSAAVSLLKKASPAKIVAISLIAAPEGVRRMETDHPEIEIVIAALDSYLNEQGYIVPGLGDAGDRMFGSYKIEAAARAF